MDHTHAPFFNTQKNPALTVLAGVAAIVAAYMYFLLFAGLAFVDNARAVVAESRLLVVLGLLGASGVAGCVRAGRRFAPERGPKQLGLGFAVCTGAALLTLAAKSEWLVWLLAVPVGAGTAWTAVTLAQCLRPTLHGARLGMWCGVGTGLAYALCNQPFIFEATTSGRIVTAAVAAAVGCAASLAMRGTPTRASTLPDYEFQAAASWVVFLFAMVFLDTLVFYVIQNSQVLRQISWETPLILQGNAFVHVCAAFITGLVLDQRWPGILGLAALLLLVASCVVLGLHTEHFPKARMLYIAAVSVYSTILIFLPARSGRVRFTTIVFAVSGWLASGLALSLAVATDARQVPPVVVGLALLVGVAALFVRLLWLRRVQEMESERIVQRKPA